VIFDYLYTRANDATTFALLSWTVSND